MLARPTEVGDEDRGARLLPPTKPGKPLLHRATRRITNLRQQRKTSLTRSKTKARSREAMACHQLRGLQRHEPGGRVVRGHAHRRTDRARSPRFAPSKAPTTAPPPQP